MSQTEQATVLRLSRHIDASREEVFDAWTHPDVLRQWWAAFPTWECTLAEVDLRPGGRYRLAMHDPESGNTHTVMGEYKEIERPERLVYTWAWESNEDAMKGSEDTLVTVEFNEDDGGTEIVLTHSGFATPELRDQHTHGWIGCLDNLQSRVFAT